MDYYELRVHLLAGLCCTLRLALLNLAYVPSSGREDGDMRRKVDIKHLKIDIALHSRTIYTCRTAMA